ncbi:MAG: hypothetical protein QXK37_04140 [Candidatus Woesearchaeota archaeon]
MSIKNTHFHTLHLQYKGICDLKGLFRVVKEWMESKGFEVVETKTKQRMRPFGMESEYDLRGYRNLSEYYRIWMIVMFQVWDEVQVEVVKNGIKEKLSKCRLYIRVRAESEMDWTNRFENSPFQEAIRKFLNEKVLKHRYESILWDQHHYKQLELFNVIKEYLSMQTRGSEYADMW